MKWSDRGKMGVDRSAQFCREIRSLLGHGVKAPVYAGLLTSVIRIRTLTYLLNDGLMNVWGTDSSPLKRELV